MSEEFIEDILSASLTEPTEPTELSAEENTDSAEATPIVEAPKEAEAPKEDAVQSGMSIEDLATQIGWNANYKGKDSVDAATYILKSREIQETMKEHNKSLKDQLSSVQGSIESLKEHNERVYQANVRNMQAEIDSLKKQKRKAVELADVEEVDSIEEQIETIQKNINKPQKSSAPTTDPAYDNWIKDNSWYLTDQEMAIYAENVAQQYQGAPLDRLYKIVTQKVAEVFPDKFAEKDLSNTKAEKVESIKQPKPIGPVSPVEAPTNKSNAPSFTKANLTPEQLNIMAQFTRQGIMTEKQYINDIAKMQES